MRIFVTAGNTQTPIDRVRCITNIFTGRTGAAIALEAERRGHVVTLATSHPDTIRPEQRSEGLQVRVYRTFDELDALMAELITGWLPDAVVHCAAVSDYLVAEVYGEPDGVIFYLGKINTDHHPEIWLRLVRAPKLVDKIRTDWKYRGLLVKFKLEVGATEAYLKVIGEISRKHSTADWMVANTLESASEWALIGNADGYKKVTRGELPGALLDVLEAPEAPHA